MITLPQEEAERLGLPSLIIRITHYRITDETYTGSFSAWAPHVPVARLKTRVVRDGREVWLKSVHELRKEGYALNNCSNTGGLTEAEVLSIIDGGEMVRIVVGQAFCRPDEPFNRKIGREVATGRAMAKLAALRRL